MKKIPINSIYGDTFIYKRKKYEIDTVRGSIYFCFEAANPKKEIRLPDNEIVGIDDEEINATVSSIHRNLIHARIKVEKLTEALKYLEGEIKCYPSKKKQPWQMTRLEWLKAGRPTCNIKWSEERIAQKITFRVGKKWEYQAICEFMSVVPKSVLGIPDWEAGRIGPNKYLPDRCESFAKRKWGIQTYSSITRTEDAREAIILGRLLGYKEQDIAYYLVRNYIVPKINLYNIKESL